METAHLMSARDHCLAPARSLVAEYGGTYDRMFPELEPLDGEGAFLHALGSRGGACDGSPYEIGRAHV